MKIDKAHPRYLRHLTTRQIDIITELIDEQIQGVTSGEIVFGTVADQADRLIELEELKVELGR